VYLVFQSNYPTRFVIQHQNNKTYSVIVQDPYAQVVDAEEEDP